MYRGQVIKIVIRSNGMKKYILVNILFILMLPMVWEGCGSSKDKDNTNILPLYDWTRQNIEFNVDLKDVFFIKGGKGFIVGDLITVFTSSTGDVWLLSPITSGSESPAAYRSVFFIDEQNGWMAGDLKSDHTGGQIAFSRNGGSYPVQQDTVAYPLNTLYFTDIHTGWAAGDSGLILSTENGGHNWITGNMGTKANIYDIQFVDKTKGWAVTANGGIFRTLDGINWQPENIGITSDLYAVHFIDTLNGWACGASNTILRRTMHQDNVISWQQITVPDELPGIKWKDIFFVDSLNGWIIGDYHRIYKSTDGGITWSMETTDVDQDINSIYMVSKTKGWIVGDNGATLTYTPK